MITEGTNNSIINFIKKYAWAFWVGMILSSLGVNASTTDFWIYVIPLLILVEISKNAKVSEDIDNLKENSKK